MFFPQPRPKKEFWKWTWGDFFAHIWLRKPKDFVCTQRNVFLSNAMPLPENAWVACTKPTLFHCPVEMHMEMLPDRKKKKNRPALWLRQLLADWTCVSRTQMTNKTRAVWFWMQIKEKCKYYEHILIKRQKGKAVWWNSAGILDTGNISCCKKCKMQSMQIFFRSPHSHWERMHS